MKTIDSINLFLQQPGIAVVGVSRNKNKFGNTIYKTLKNRGVKVIPVNPHLTDFEGDVCFSSIATLPTEIKALLINTPPEQTLKVAEEAFHKGIKHIWLQQGSSNESVVEYLKDKDISYITDRCIMMFAEPVGSFHGIHRFLSKVTGNFPK